MTKAERNRAALPISVWSRCPRKNPDWGLSRAARGYLIRGTPKLFLNTFARVARAIAGLQFSERCV
jgi:hypothetical protein